MNICYLNLRTLIDLKKKMKMKRLSWIFWGKQSGKFHKFTWARRHHFRQRARLNPQWRQYRKIAWCFLHFFCETAKCQNQCHLTKAKFTSKLKKYQNKHCFSLNQSQDFSAYRMISLKGAILGQVLLEFRFLIWILL